MQLVEERTGLIWPLSGHYLVFVWSLYGLCLAIVWSLFGHCLVFVWPLSGLCLAMNGDSVRYRASCWNTLHRPLKTVSSNDSLDGLEQTPPPLVTPLMISSQTHSSVLRLNFSSHHPQNWVWIYVYKIYRLKLYIYVSIYSNIVQTVINYNWLRGRSKISSSVITSGV